MGGIETYASGTPSDKVVVIVTDVWGHKVSNVKLMADQFAEAGFYVLTPDLFNGDPVPANPPADFDLFTVWLPKHGPAVTRPIVDQFMAGLASEVKPKYVAAVGYCYGAKYAIQLLGEGSVHAAGVAHPSFVTIEEAKAIKGPLLICGCEIDPIYTDDLRHQTEAALKEIGATYHTTFAAGCEHGFSIRGDVSKPLVKLAKEKAFNDMVWWFKSFAPN